MQKQSPLKKWLMLISLGFMGGTFYMSAYVGWTYYTQLLEALNMTDTQYGLSQTLLGPIGIILIIPGAFLGDKFDAKKTLLFSIGSQSILNLSWPLWVHSFVTYIAWNVVYNFITMAYWGALIKYINNLDGEDSAGSSFTIYYLINGLSGAVGSFIPLWVADAMGAGVGMIVFVMGIITAVATVLVAIFLEDEKQLAQRGIFLKGDDPIEIKHIFYLIKYPGFWMMFFAYGLGVSFYNYISYFNPYLTDVFGMSPSLSSALNIIRQYAVNLVAPVGGYICDKVLKATYKWYIVGFGILTVMFAAMTVLFNENSNVVIVGIYTVILAAMVMMVYTTLWSVLRELHVPTMVTATLSGIATISERVIGMFVPLMFGNFIDTMEPAKAYNCIFLGMAVIGALAVLNGVWIGIHHKKCLAGLRSFAKMTGMKEAEGAE
ncbi:MAG: MFS transporter [Clostridiales bacterium]|nr:MFS transporter [Clostridiales bacterium]